MLLFKFCYLDHILILNEPVNKEKKKKTKYDILTFCKRNLKQRKKKLFLILYLFCKYGSE